MSAEFLVTKGPDSLGHTSESHPSYGVISVSRVSGNASLFESDVIHGQFIRITVHEASKERSGFTHEHVHSHKRLVEINMSFAQFAQFITTQNVGVGTPCTISYVQGDESKPYANKWGGRPSAPEPASFVDKFKGVGKDRADMILNSIQQAKDLVSSLLSGTDKPTKANLKTAHDSLSSAHQNVKSNLPYLMECLDEEMEKKLSNAVTEFESYVAGSLQDKGLEVMQSGIRLNLGAGSNLHIESSDLK